MGKSDFLAAFGCGNLVLKELASATSNLSQEEPPFEFRVEYFQKTHGTAFNRLALFNTILLDMSFSAIRNWNDSVAVVRYPAPFRIAINFVSDHSGALKLKHLMWTLEELFDIFVESQRYVSGSVVVDITPTRLAVGNVQSALPALTPVTTTNTPVGGVPPDGTLKSLSAVDFQYRPNGVTFHDAQIYNTSLKLHIKAAEASNLQGSIGPILSVYNDMDDFTFSFTSKPLVTSTALRWWDCIDSINAIVYKMGDQGPKGRWAEIDGLIRDETAVIGSFCIDKGDMTNLDPGVVCNKAFPGHVSNSRL